MRTNEPLVAQAVVDGNSMRDLIFRAAVTILVLILASRIAG